MLAQLKHIGLLENEAKVYLAMLELGPAPMLEIAAKAGINRPTAYAQLETLKKKGLVSTQTKGKKHLFIAEDPEQLEILVNQEKKLLSQKEEELTSILPELRDMFNLAEEKPHVRFFEGKEGLVRMQKDVLTSGVESVTGITALDDLFRIFPEHIRSYTPKRVQHGIRSKLIYTASEPILKEHDKEMLREARYIPAADFDYHADILIYGDRISISALQGKLSGLIINHKDLADSFRAVINELWRHLSKSPH